MKDLYHLLLKKTAHFQVEHPWMTLIIIAALTLAVYGGVSRVRTVASLEQMMPSDIEEIKAFNTLRDNNLGKDMIAIVISVDSDSTQNGVIDIRDKRVYDYILHLQDSLRDEPDVLELHAMTDYLSDNLSQKEYQLQIREKDEVLRQYINHDYTTTILVLNTDVSADDTRMNLLTSKIKDIVDSSGHPAGTQVRLTGTPVIQQRLGELITRDRANTKSISTLLVFIITMLVFGTITSAIVPIIVVTVSVAWLYGVMGYTGLPISTLAGGVAAMVIGIGIDFAIHIMNKFKYERRKGNDLKIALENAVVETGTALTATSLTTIAAFMAFLVGSMPEMGRFGLLMTIGIFFSLVFSLFGLPALLILEEKLIYFLRTRVRFGVEGEFTLKTDEEVCKRK